MLKTGMLLKHKNRAGELQVIDLIGWMDHARLKLPTGDEIDASIDAIINKITSGDYIIIEEEPLKTAGSPIAVRIGDVTELEPAGQLTHQDSAGIFAHALSWMLKPNEGISVKVGPVTYSVINEAKSQKIVINKIDGNMPDGQMLWADNKPPVDDDDDEDDDD